MVLSFPEVYRTHVNSALALVAALIDIRLLDTVVNALTNCLDPPDSFVSNLTDPLLPFAIRYFFPTSIVVANLYSYITAGVTVTEQVSVRPPSVVVTVIVTLPVLTPVTRPLLTVAIDWLLLLQLTLLSVALAGYTVSVSCVVPPASTDTVFGLIVTLVGCTVSAV